MGNQAASFSDAGTLCGRCSKQVKSVDSKVRLSARAGTRLGKDTGL